MLGPSRKSITPKALPGDAPNNCNAKLSGDRLRFCQEHGGDQIPLSHIAWNQNGMLYTFDEDKRKFGQP